MALRVLGYKTYIEKLGGTWPTNYISKAQEIKLLKDVKYSNYLDGATRGNVALIIWNLLRAPMWDVTGENEKDGLSFGENGATMIDKYFEDYTYATVKFGSFSIDDGKVEVTLNEDVKDEKDAKLGKVDGKYEYAGNDFYTFVEGQEVEVLVNEEDETLLTMVSTDSDTLKEGVKDSIDKNYDELKDKTYDYAYTRIAKKVIKAANILSTKSIYVDDVAKDDKYVEINDERYGIDGNEYKNTFATTKTDFDAEIIIKDGERVSISDVKEGDILTQVTITTLNSQSSETFYVIGSTSVEGDLTRCAKVKYENSTLTFVQATIGKQKYTMDDNASYVENPNAKKLNVVYFNDYSSAIIKKMEGETVTAYLDTVAGKVVRVEFDGKIDSGNNDNTTVKFFGIVDSVDKSGKVYSIDLINEDGKETLEFAKNSTAESKAKTQFANGTDLTGAFVWVKLDDEDKIADFAVVAAYGNQNSQDFTKTDIPYGEKATEVYKVLELVDASYDADSDYVKAKDGASQIRVNDNTVLVKVIYDDKGTAKTTDDEYRIEFETGLQAIKSDVKSKTVCAINDDDSSFKRALYLVMFDTASSKSDNQVAKVVTPESEGTYIGGKMIDLEEIDGTESSLTIASDEERDLSAYKLVVYTVTTNAKGKETFNYVAGLNDAELSDSYTKHAYVGECDENGRTFLRDNDKSQEFDLDSKELKDRLEDYMVIEVTVRESDKSTDETKDYEVSNYKVVSYDDISLTEGDRISIDKYDLSNPTDKGAEVMFVIHGLAKKNN